MGEFLKPPSQFAFEQVRRDIQNGVTYPDLWPERKPAKKRKSGAQSATKKRKSGAQSATKKGQ